MLEIFFEKSVVDFFFAGPHRDCAPGPGGKFFLRWKKFSSPPWTQHAFGLRTLVRTGSRSTASQTCLFQCFLHSVFLSGQINMKDLQLAAQKENSYFRDFYFSSCGHFLVNFVTSSPQFSMNFRDSSKNKNRRIFKIIFPILFGTFRIFHKLLITSEVGQGGLNIHKCDMAKNLCQRGPLP